jgi:glycolate oxidase iron-sulfur subunit
MTSVKDYIEEAKRCVRCGVCKSICPTYEVLRREPASPRGRVALIEATLGGDSLKGSYLRHIRDCTLCGACVSACPKKVDVPALVLKARQERAENLPSFVSFALKNVLTSPRFLNLCARVGGKLKGVFFKPVENGLISRFSLASAGGGRLFPELAAEFFLDRARTKSLSSVKGARTGFYVGCGVNYLLPEIGEATVKAIESIGEKIAVPSAQVCCGMPALSYGDVATARELAIKNIEAFDSGDFDYIVVSCATCGHALKNVFKTLFGDSPEFKERAERVAKKVRDITEFLSGIGYKEKGKRPETVTYHDPCHLRRYQGISEEPRELIKKAGYAFKGMKNPCKCCGLGGGVAFTNYALSQKIAAKKAASIAASGADIVATACPGCIIQLKDALHRSGVKARVAHVVELVSD